MLRQLQTSLPWTIKYSTDFRSNPQSHKDFAHALLHVSKSTGYLAAFVDKMDHNRNWTLEVDCRDAHAKVADLVICALRMANTFPGGTFDLESAVVNRLETKNNVKIPQTKEDSVWGALVHAIKWITARKNISFDHMEGTSGDEFRLMSEMYGLASTELEAIKKILDQK